jgi:hypothetical protein
LPSRSAYQGDVTETLSASNNFVKVKNFALCCLFQTKTGKSENERFPTGERGLHKTHVEEYYSQSAAIQSIAQKKLVVTQKRCDNESLKQKVKKDFFPVSTARIETA